MDTIVIKTSNTIKTKHLMELLKSMDFVSQVEYLDTYIKGQKLLEGLNKIAAGSMSPEEINAEISAYRNGK